MEKNPLTAEEKLVIEDKGTEPPFTGKYHDHFADGVYHCKRCGAPLYDSRAKFQAHCGWPSFDEEFPGAVRRQPDPDGIRTEILCADCGAHLGHVFTGEGFTEKNIRHCVNSVSLHFTPRKLQPGEKGIAVLGGGCFWCTEAAFNEVRGVEKVVSGYAGGSTANPSYEEVCRGDTGHAEVVKIVYDPEEVSFRQLLKVFFAIHNPTTPNRQLNDFGSIYRSVIFYTTWEQKEESQEMIEELTAEKAFEQPIVTELEPLLHFYPAESYHQDYIRKNQHQAYSRFQIAPKVAKVKELDLS